MSTTISTRRPEDLITDLRGSRPPLVIDVRTTAEFAANHIRGSYNVPLALIGEHGRDIAAEVPARSVLVCASGVRAEQARQRLAAEGIDDACILEGGVTGFESAGGDVVRARSTWALERQVRLVAGSLVVAGLLGGRFLDPRLRTLSTAIGTGLTFSAVSDTCAMGRALAAMPWNRGVRELQVHEAVEALAAR